MKRQLKTLKGKRVVLTNNANEITRNEIGIIEKQDGTLEVKEHDANGNIENIAGGSSNGGSSKIKYYNCIDGNAMALAGAAGAEGHIAHMNVYSYDDNGNAIDTYIASYKMLEQQGLRFAVRHIAFLPISVVMEGGIRLTFNSFEELLSMTGNSDYIELFKEISEEEFYKID